MVESDKGNLVIDMEINQLVNQMLNRVQEAFSLDFSSDFDLNAHCGSIWYLYGFAFNTGLE